MKLRMLFGVGLAAVSFSGLAATGADAERNPTWDTPNALWTCPDSYVQKMEQVSTEDWTEERVLSQPPGGLLPVDRYCRGIVLPPNPELVEAIAKEITACAEVDGVMTLPVIHECIARFLTEHPALARYHVRQIRRYAKRRASRGRALDVPVAAAS